MVAQMAWDAGVGSHRRYGAVGHRRPHEGGATLGATAMTLTTKRVSLPPVSVCVGCCCGRVDRGKPDVPVDWLKAEWKRRKLAGRVHLSISGGLGPCDLVNVVSVADCRGTTWLGGLATKADFESQLEWATHCAREGHRFPLPARFDARRFERFVGRARSPRRAIGSSPVTGAAIDEGRLRAWLRRS